MNYAVFDLETTTKEIYGRTANPFFNEIVAYAVKTEDKEIVQQVTDLEEGREEVYSFLKDSDVFVAFNAKFDLLYIYNEIKDEFKDRKKKIYCPQLAEYYLTNLQRKWYDCPLRDLAVNTYSCRARKKNIEDYFKKGIDTLDIPINEVLEDVQNDVKDTEIIYLKQQREVQSRNKAFQNLLEIQMDFLLATTEMEYNGIKIDKKTLLQNKEELQEELQDVEKKLETLISKYWVAE